MSTQMINCGACGTAMPVDTRFCPVCGRANDQVAAAPGGQPSFTTPMAPPSFTPPAEERARADLTAPPSGQETQYFPQQPQPMPQPGPQPEPYGASTPPSYSQQPATQYAPPPVQNQSLIEYPHADPPVAAYGQPVSTNYQFQPAPGVAGVIRRDPTLALLLELLGYIGILGVGHIYAGRITRGVAVMVAYWAYWAIVGFFVITLLGIPVACFLALVYPFVPFLSGIWARGDVERDNMLYPTRPV